MKQYFADTLTGGNQKPVLFYASHVPKEDNKYPRIMHKHLDFLELLLITGGEGKYFIDNRQYKIKKGDLIVLNSGVIHDERINEEVSLYCCAVKNIKYIDQPENCLPLLMDNPIINAERYFDELSSLFKMIFEFLAVGDKNGQFIAQKMTEALCSLIHYRLLKQTINATEELSVEMQNDSEMIKRVKDYIDEQFRSEVTLQLLAEKFNISSYYLAHLFKDKLGYSPGQYVLRRRIGEAQTLLLTTDMKIIEIASEVGYDSVSNFNSVFKNKVGMTPTEYRHKYLSYSNK
ncbi:AraC family transcriptional regulator [Enterococcus sp. AZ109]|uniref:AraC family transcriptional regulator n=1 Tax=Enterococcus sp. AZ109 TaxID=2774634 RepID=UPI003F291A2B